jgi:small neutral amino acid transporter SnatA (MarC family)
MGWVLAGCGAFAICGAAFDWEWFMNHRKAQFFVRLFGRNGTRVFYAVLGSALVVLGVLMAAGIIRDSG